jgi:hypothetical protein
MDGYDDSISFISLCGEHLLPLLKRLPKISHFIVDPDDGKVDMWTCLDYEEFLMLIPDIC